MKKSLALFTLLLSLLCATPATPQTPYGSGTPGSGGFVPVLSSDAAWLGNLSYSLHVSNAMGGVPAVFLLSQAPWSLMVGGTEILVDLLPTSYIFAQSIGLGGTAGIPGAGTGSLTLPLPASLDPALMGFEFYAQALILDMPPGGALAATQGVEVVIGSAPLVFVGTSVGGSTDPYYLVDPVGMTLVHQGGSTSSDNVTDALFDRGGRDLYVSSSIQGRIEKADMRVSPPAWSTYYSAGGACYGLRKDEAHKILYTLTGSGTAMELTGLDVDPQSASYGAVVAATSGIASGAAIERWDLSPSGALAAILTVFSNEIILVDTDPTSPFYMQQVARQPIPGSGFRISVHVRITPDDQLALILIQQSGTTPGEIARFHIPSQQFLDHDPSVAGIQHIGTASSPAAALGSAPGGFALSSDGSFAIVTGWSRGGFAGRLDQDLTNLASFSYTSFAPPPGITFDGAWACDLSRDQQSCAITTFPSPSAVHFLDARTGAHLGSVALPGASNVYTVRYN